MAEQRKRRRTRKGESAPGWRAGDATEMVQELGLMTLAVAALIECEGRVDASGQVWRAANDGIGAEERLAGLVGRLRASLQVCGEAWGLSPDTMSLREEMHGRFLRRRIERRTPEPTG